MHGPESATPGPHAELAPVARGEACQASFTASCGKAPLHMVGAVSSWPACAHWTDREKLAARLGGLDTLVPCELSSEAGGRFDTAGGSVQLTRVQLPVSAVLDRTLFSPLPGGSTELSPQQQQQQQHAYCKLPLGEALLADLGEVQARQRTHARALLCAGVGGAEQTRFWMGSRGNVSPLHFDLCHALIVQVVGRKRVLLCAPADSGFVYPCAAGTGSPRQSRVDLQLWLAGDAAECLKHPLLSRVQLLECVLQPGDALYLPPAWWHQVEALEGNISVLLPFDMTPEEHRVLPRPWTLPGWGV